MTPAGKVRLRKEVDFLKNIERPRISKEIEVAREHGDLKENAEYHAAKDKQGIVEAKLRVMEGMLSAAEVIDPTKMSGNRVVFGATVTLLDVKNDQELIYSIVGEHEADFKKGLLNLKSPIARGVLGKEEGDEVTVKTGAGDRIFEILEVEFREIPLPASTILPKG